MASKESFSINGESIVIKVKKLINEGNVTKITITNHDGKEMMSFPVTYGLVGLLMAPVFAAVGAAAALLTECTITVERKGDAPEEKNELHKFE